MRGEFVIQKSNPFTFIGLLSVGMLLFGVPSHAGQEQATVSGTIQDQAGLVLPGVMVTVSDPSSGNSRSVVSDGRGFYEITRLESGTYEIQGVLPGFQSQVVNVMVTAGQMLSHDITLSIAPLTETVTVTRTGSELAGVPAAVGVVVGDDIQFAQRRASPAEALQAVPGLFVQNRRNYSFSGGVRLSIRAPVRSFGMRGLQILQDGIPLTTADGTTQPNNIDLGTMGQAEIIRGPSSVLYGNSAGGVMNLTTEFAPPGTLTITPDIQFGSYGYQRQQLKVAGTADRVGYVLNFTRLETEGFRRDEATGYGSNTEIRQVNTVVRAELSPNTEIRGVFNVFDMPFGEGASTMNRSDAENNPRSVRSLAVRQGFGESATQGQGGVTLEHNFGGGHILRATGWAMWRDLYNPIPFRIIDLGRTGNGFRSEYLGGTTLGNTPVDWTVGFDLSSQRDGRQEFGNAGPPAGPGDLSGGLSQRGSLRVEQNENVLSLGPFAQVGIEPHPRWRLTAGVRYDYFDYDVTDLLLSNGDQSGGRTLDAASPMAGVTFEAAPGVNIYGTYATAYETPTTVELSNRPSGEGGFNEDLNAADLRSFEGGVRGLIEPWRLRYEFAGYRSSLGNALVPFQNVSEQTFFRNAGESSRNGIELFLDWTPVSNVRTRLAYTYQDFQFVDFVTASANYSGNMEPGAPPHFAFWDLTYAAPFGLRSTIHLNWVDSYVVNNANTVSNWAYTVVGLRFGLETRATNRLGIRPFIGIDNLMGTRYNSSTIPNAFGRRYFEPSPGREVYGGFTLGLGPF